MYIYIYGNKIYIYTYIFIYNNIYIGIICIKKLVYSFLNKLFLNFFVAKSLLSKRF